MATTTDAVQILKRKLGDVPGLDERIEVDKLNVRVAMLIYQVRTEANLSQADLAQLVGTSQPNIARLEDADYEGHSLSMLQKIAEALGKRIEIQMVDAEAHA
jgi:DNA-binding XRE family transcriptional regulator